MASYQVRELLMVAFAVSTSTRHTPRAALALIPDSGVGEFTGRNLAGHSGRLTPLAAPDVLQLPNVIGSKISAAALAQFLRVFIGSFPCFGGVYLGGVRQVFGRFCGLLRDQEVAPSGVTLRPVLGFLGHREVGSIPGGVDRNDEDHGGNGAAEDLARW
ncbi:hypothetical protein EV291_1023 [Rhizobium sp. BK068]|nr:hypothetical protein EV291_1023 [Rhizobium sp. BK068]